MAHEVLKKMFALVHLLMQAPPKNTIQLAAKLGTKRRNIYNYLETLKDLEYPINNEGDNYYINTDIKDDVKTAFSSEEYAFLNDIITKNTQKHPLQESILKKIYIHGKTTALAFNLLQVHVGPNINALSEAIKNKKQVLLKDYQSVNSETTTDRIIEPYEFENDYDIIKGYDLQRKAVRNFKITRIANVETLDTDQTTKNTHFTQSDLFGMVGEPFEVSLGLTARAYLILIENYPATKDFTRQTSENTYTFTAKVQAVEGVGRFVLGMAGKATVIHSDKLKTYLNEKINEMRF